MGVVQACQPIVITVLLALCSEQFQGHLMQLRHAVI